MSISLQSHKEYMKTMQDRYRLAKNRTEKSLIIDEIISVTAFNRKYVLQKLNGLVPAAKPKSDKRRKLKYQKLWLLYKPFGER